MPKFTAQQIQDKYNTLPEELQNAITSVDIHNEIVDIAKKNNLLIDQEGELVNIIGMMMLGLTPSKDFVKEFTNRTGVNNNEAKKIANEINSEIFAKIKNSIKMIDAGGNETEDVYINKKSNSDLEQLGGINVEVDNPNPVAQKFGSQVLEGNSNIVESKDDIISGIENPSPAVPSTPPIQIKPLPSHKVMPPENLPTIQPKVSEEPHLDSMIDHLMGNPIVNNEQKIENIEVIKPANTEEVKKIPVNQEKKLSDSYREPIQ